MPRIPSVHICIYLTYHLHPDGAHCFIRSWNMPFPFSFSRRIKVHAHHTRVLNAVKCLGYFSRRNMMWTPSNEMEFKIFNYRAMLAGAMNEDHFPHRCANLASTKRTPKEPHALFPVISTSKQGPTNLPHQELSAWKCLLLTWRWAGSKQVAAHSMMWPGRQAIYPVKDISHPGSVKHSMLTFRQIASCTVSSVPASFWKSSTRSHKQASKQAKGLLKEELTYFKCISKQNEHMIFKINTANICVRFTPKKRSIYFSLMKEWKEN